MLLLRGKWDHLALTPKTVLFQGFKGGKKVVKLVQGFHCIESTMAKATTLMIE